MVSKHEKACNILEEIINLQVEDIYTIPLKKEDIKLKRVG